MDPITRQAISVAGSGSSDPLYVDDVFSTFLYDGTNSTQSINNGIDLSGEGGLTWIKRRETAGNHVLYDTERGATKSLYSAETDAENTRTGGLTSFNSNGFTLGGFSYENYNGESHVSWSFRKAPGFFDVVTYTGDGNSNTGISHALGTTPGMIIIKATSGSYGWAVYHRSVGAGNKLALNSTDAFSSASNFYSSAPTASVFYPGNSTWTNDINVTYVAYIFAHDDQSFGTDSDEAIINCGTFSTDSNGRFSTVNLGFEPQFLLVKSTSVGNWFLIDSMRGLGVSYTRTLRSNDNGSDSLYQSEGYLVPEANGFKSTLNLLGSSQTFIYMAIRRPHKPPTAGTEVFKPKYYSHSRTGSWTSTSGFVSDAFLTKTRAYAFNWELGSRFTAKSLRPDTSEAEQNYYFYKFDTQDGVRAGGTNYFSTNTSYADYHFRRAPGFFDVVPYTGSNSSGSSSYTHNLEAVPELMVIRVRNYGGQWYVYTPVVGNSKYLRFNGNDAESTGVTWTTPTATQFTVGAGFNATHENYLVYLFATLDGISKVGSYTGTGYNINVDCGFTAGARFVMIKRTDGSGDWYIWDSARGIVSGNDAYLILNDTDTETTSTDYIDPLNAGFTVTSSAPAALNTSGGTYLFLAIA